MKKVQIKKVVSNNMETIFPQTSADMVIYDANNSVLDILDDVLSELASLRSLISENIVSLYDDSEEEIVPELESINSSSEESAVIDDGSGNDIV